MASAGTEDIAAVAAEVVEAGMLERDGEEE